MKKILVNHNPWEIRVAIVRDNVLENLFLGQTTDTELERAFFKGKVIKVLPGIQTAFVDIGQERAGFLHVSEIDHDLAINRIMGPDQVEEIKDTDEDYKPRVSSEKLDIAKILHEGEDLLVQVSKEPVDEKGAKLKTCFTLPGRFIVLTHNIARIGVSKKIEDRNERSRLKEIIVTSYATINAKSKIYEDVNIALQVIRDHLDADIDEIVTDSKQNHDEIYKYLSKVAPEFKYKVKLISDNSDLFERYNIDQQIKEALEKKV